MEPATHVWINSGSSTIYAAVSSKKGCEILTQQAAMLNSATGHCYLKEQFLEEINCLKSLQLGDTPSCKMNGKPTR
ncbi:MAG: hypothetical protein LRY51_08490 [Geovibrio sp.]|nr:hypothetical protein [Geovibrio sp.]